MLSLRVIAVLSSFAAACCQSGSSDGVSSSWNDMVIEEQLTPPVVAPPPPPPPPVVSPPPPPPPPPSPVDLGGDTEGVVAVCDRVAGTCDITGPEGYVPPPMVKVKSKLTVAVDISTIGEGSDVSFVTSKRHSDSSGLLAA